MRRKLADGKHVGRSEHEAADGPSEVGGRGSRGKVPVTGSGNTSPADHGLTLPAGHAGKIGRGRTKIGLSTPQRGLLILLPATVGGGVPILGARPLKVSVAPKALPNGDVQVAPT